MKIGICCVAASSLIAPALTAQVQVASLGTCPLEMGGSVEDCRLGYMTFGTLAPDRRNAVLIPTWFASRAEAWRPLLGPEALVDTTGFYVVVVESLGAGSSSSPSTSRTQAGVTFPEITVGDMVEASYRLAREQLGLPELYAVVGISLGGLEAFEWAVSHPEYVRRVVPIVGTPRQAVYDRAMWELIAEAADRRVRGLAPEEAGSDDLARLLVLAGTSPEAANRQPTSRYLVAEREQVAAADMFEWAWHARAILRHDVTRHYGGDLTRAASVWKGRMLVVTATNDHSISPQPAQEFARYVDADTLVLSGAAGHVDIFSNRQAQAAVRAFLRR